MSRLRRCLPGSAVSLSLTCASCFSPTGSVFATSTSGDSSTTLAVTTTGPLTGTSTTSGDTDVDTSTGTTEPTEPGTTLAPTTSSSSETSETDATTQPDTPVCGNGKVEPDEQCDDGKNNNDAAKCTSNCVVATCGDGLRCLDCEAIEECDDANLESGDGCEGCRIPGPLMFVTPTMWPGNVTLGQANKICQDLGVIHFAPDRQFIAWLSTPAEPLNLRIGMSKVAYRLPGGEVVADNTTALLAGMVVHAVDQEPSGATIPGGDQCGNTTSLVWTGANADGMATIDHCDSWNSTSGLGWAGYYASTGVAWTLACSVDCSTFLRLYCIETAS